MRQFPTGFEFKHTNKNSEDTNPSLSTILNPEIKGKTKVHRWVMHENHNFDIIPDSYESYYLLFILQGKMKCINNDLILESMDSVVINNSNDYAVFRTLTECTVLFVSIGDYDFQKSYGCHSKLLEDYVHRINDMDHYTLGHSLRVKYLSIELALFLNRTDVVIEALYYASLYHDAGKINVPKNILNKPGKLTANQFRKIHKHPFDSFNLIRDSMDKRTSEIVLQHHERLDGSGYPKGILSEEILPEAKIIAICDSFDAIQSKRVYSESHSINETIEIIKDGAGSLYDPEIVLALESMLKEKDFYTYKIPLDYNEDYQAPSILN